MKTSNNTEVGFRKSVAYKKSVYISNLQLIPREEVENRYIEYNEKVMFSQMF